MNVKQAHIEIFGRFAEILSQYEPLLAPLFTCSLSRFASGGPLGHRYLREEKKLYDVEDGHLLFPAGMVPDVVGTLRRAGINAAVTTRPYICNMQLNQDLLTSLPNEESQLLQAAAQQFGGLIQVTRNSNVTFLIGLMLQFFPSARILIAVATNAELRRLRSQLAELGHDIKTPDNWTWGSGNRLLICTLHLFGSCNRHDWDLVILPDAVHAAAKTHAQGLVNFQSRPVFGFLVATDKLSQHTRLWLQSTCGPLIYSMPHGDGYQADAQVEFLSPPWSPPVIGAEALERKRLSIWHNGPRNDYIAAVARALATGNVEEQWQLGIFDQGNEQTNEQTGGKLPQVTILTESTEHARELLRRLPSWELWSMSPEEWDHRWRRARAKGWSALVPYSFDKKIITLAMASKLEGLDTDVLVRADGSPWPWNVPGFPPRLPNPGRTVRLIDLADDGDADAVDAGRRRLRDYQSQGWRIASAPSWLLAPGADIGESDAGKRSRSGRSDRPPSASRRARR